MPKYDKSYLISIAADKGSLEEFQKQVTNAFSKATKDGKIHGLTNKDKATIQNDLSALFGIAEYQAEALREMVQGLVPKDAGKIAEMKDNLHATLEFTTGLAQKMRELGTASEWMNQGINLAGFTDMQNSIEVTAQDVSGLRSDLNELTKQFKEFREAAYTPASSSFAKTLTAEAQDIADSIAVAQKKIEGLKKARSSAIKKIAATEYELDPNETLFTAEESKAWSVEDVKEEYRDIRDAIKTTLDEIAKLEESYDDKTTLYKSKKYQNAIVKLKKNLVGAKFIEEHNLFNDAFGGSNEQLNATLRRVTSEITDTVAKASKSIKDVVDEIAGEGVELAITLPDANSEEFVSKVDKFVKNATKQFKTKPISVFATIKNPFTETTSPDGSQSNDIADKFTESIQSAKNAINVGYKELTTAVNNDNSTLKNALTLKFDYKKSINDEVIADALADMQNTIYESAPLNIVFETENVAEKLAGNIQEALKDIELPTFSVPTFSTDHFSTEQFSGGAIPVQIVGMAPIVQEQDQSQTPPPKSEIHSQIPTVFKPQQQNPNVSDGGKSNKPVIKPTKDIGELRIISALNKLLQGLQGAMETQQNIIARETANIKGHSDNLKAHESDIQAARKRNEIIDKRLEKPNARKDKIQAEQKIIATKLQEVKDAYAIKYQELFAGDEYKTIRGLDEGLAMLQESFQTTQQEYVDKLKNINKTIKETQSKMDKATSEEEKLALSILLDSQEAKRSEINDEYTEKLGKFETSITKNREAYAAELDKNINAQKIDAELQPLRTAINDVATQLQAKREELDAVIKEIQQIKVDVRSEQLNKQLNEPTERREKLQDEKKVLTTQHTDARKAYDEKYKELLTTKDGATIGALDKSYETLQNNYNRIKDEYERKIKQINDSIAEIQKRKGTSAVVDSQIPDLIKAQEAMRAEVEAKYAEELAKIETDMKTNRDSHANALRGDDNTNHIYGELQSLKNDANKLADKLATKQKELEGVLEEIKVIKQSFQDGEDLLGDQNPKKQIEASAKRVGNAEKESGKIQKRTQMVQEIMNDGEDPSKYVLETTNEFWQATKRSIATAEKSMMKRVTSDAMRSGVTQLFNQIFSAQENLGKINDKDSNEYKLAKAHLDGLMQRITDDTTKNYLTQFLSEQKKLKTLDPKSSDYQQVQTNVNSLIQNATKNMAEAMKNNLNQLFVEQKNIESLDPKSEDYKRARESINQLWTKIGEAAKALTGQDAKTFNNNVSRFNNAYNAREGMSLLGLNDMSELVQEEAIRIVRDLLSKHVVTSESVSNLGNSYGLSDLSDYVGIAKTAMGVEDKTFAQYNKDIQAENALIQIARNMAMLRQLYQAFPKDNELPSASTIEKFIQSFGGFSEMGDVVESAAKYLSALQNINALKDDIPLLRTLDDSGILETQLPKIFKTMYGHLSDDDRQKLSTVAGGYGLKDVDIAKLDGDALIDAFTKMTTAFANNAFKDLDLQNPIFKQIEKLLSYNASVISAQKDLQDAIGYRRNYLQSATYTTQGRAGGPARTKTDNVYDVLQSNAPLNVRVVNGKNDYVASIYNPKGSPGEANRKYKANPIGFSNFAFEAGIRNEMAEIVEASLRETLLNNVSSMLASWSDGYAPTAGEIFQLASALPEEFKPEDFIDEDGIVIEVDELRKYVQKQKDSLVSASQLMRELVESGRIQVALGKNSITPDYAKKDNNYSESDISEQIEKEKRLEKEIKALKNKDYTALDKETRARITGDYSRIDDVTKARITGDYSALNPADQKKARELGALLPINVNDLIADKQAELDALRNVRISTDKEIDAIIAIEDDLQARRAKQDKLVREKNAEESAARALDRYGKNANQYKQATGRERAKYKNGYASVEELLDNIEFAKSYGIGDTSKLEETADAYRKAIAKKDALEESGATEEELATAIKEVDDAEEALIKQYFDNGSWKVIKHLQQQFANAKTNRDASMRGLQSELDAAENSHQKTEDEINKLHTDNIASINESQMSLSHKYLETPKLDIDKQNFEYEKAVEEKRKEIEKQRAELIAKADADPKIAKLKAEAIAAMDTDEYKMLQSEWQKSLVSNTPEAKQKQKELRAKLDEYEQKYQKARNKWIETKSNQLDEELKEFISSVEQQIYVSANANHATEIAAKKSEIEAKKKALTKDVNNAEKAPEVARLKKQWKDLEAKAKTAADVNDRASAIKLDNQALDAKERYETAKRSWITSQIASLDQELIDYIKQLELNDRTVANFNANLPEGAQVANSIEDVRAYIRETHERLLAAENERFKQELDAAKNGGSSVNVEARKREIEQQEEVDRQAAVKKVTKDGLIMTDTQFMAQQHRDAAAEKAKKVQEDQNEIDRLERERKIIRERAQVEDESIAKRRALIQEERAANSKASPRTTTPTNTQTTLAMTTTGSNGVAMMTLGGAGIGIDTAALVADLSSSNLARESTLRGVYELLNGGSPKGGWDGTNGATTQPKGNTSGQPANASVADVAKQDADKIFATSVSKIIKQLSSRTTREAMAFIGADGHIGKLIEGTKDNVPGDKISAALAAEIKKVFAMIHNHPSKIAGMSDVDLASAVKYAYGDKPVKVHGSVANGLLTSVNFDGIDESTANAILGEYNKALMQLTKDKAHLFGTNKDGRFAIKDVRNNPELQKEVSEALYIALKNAFTAFKHGDAVQQVGVDGLDAWKNSIIPKTQQISASNTANTPTESEAKKAPVQLNEIDIDKVRSALNNIVQLANASSLNLEKLIPALNIGTNYVDAMSKDSSVYNEKNTGLIINALNKAINSKDFGMVDKDDADVVKQFRDYFVNLAKSKKSQLKQEENTNNQTNNVAQKEQEAAERRAQAERKAADAAERRANAENEAIARDEMRVPQSGRDDKGSIHDIARESTLQKIYDVLSNGVKVTSDGKVGGGSEGKESKPKDPKLSASIGISEAETMLQDWISDKYPNIIKNSSSVRETMLGYSMDIARPKNLQGIIQAQEEIKSLEAEIAQYIANEQDETNACKVAKDNLAKAQLRYQGLLKETEQITISISRNGKTFHETSAFKNLDFGIKAANKELATVEATMNRLHDSRAISMDETGGFIANNSKVEKYLNSLKELQKFKGGLTTEGLFQPENQQRLDELALATQNARKEMTLYLDAVARYNSGEHFDVYGGTLDNNEAVKANLKSMLSASNQTIEKFGDLKKVTNRYGETVAYQLAYSLRIGKKEVQAMTASINPLTREITLQEGALKTVDTGWEKFWKGLKGKAASIVQYIASITSIQDIIRYAREGVQYVREIDSALTELKKVTDETDASYKRFLQDMAKTGSVIGVTVTDLTSSAADWARLGSIIKSAPLYSDI